MIDVYSTLGKQTEYCLKTKAKFSQKAKNKNEIPKVYVIRTEHCHERMAVFQFDESSNIVCSFDAYSIFIQKDFFLSNWLHALGVSLLQTFMQPLKS